MYFRSKCDYCKIRKYEQNSGKVQYLCESHFKLEEKKVQMEFKDEVEEEKCEMCKVTRRVCRYKDGDGKNQKHYPWVCETHSDRCPEHEAALTSEC